MKIQKLPAETRSKLQSGVIITDAIQCVLELVHNSLDAEATGIAVRIDLKLYQIQVIDNGRGIPKDDLEFVGERYMTSKYQSTFDSESFFSTYGYKGQALSSLLEVSKSVIIETKSEIEGPAFKKVFQNNTALPITVTDSKKLGTGTTVTVEDFMYTMPVRRKRITEVFDLEEIKNQLQYLAIIHHNVCFTLRNENKSLILLQTPQASNTLESLTNLYGKRLVKSLKTIHYKENKYVVDGFISIQPQNQSNVQLLYLNKRIITKGVIHKFINNLTKEYNRKMLLSSSPVEQVMKKLKGSFRYVFIIQIQCPCSYYELFTNLRSTTVEFRNWKDLLKCVHKAIKRSFKNFTNLDSSSGSLHLNEECEDLKNNDDKKTFGTSLLVNAVKGAPAKRSLSMKKNVKKRKKMRVNEVIENNSLPKSINKPLDESLSTIVEQKEYINDSLESPIPKKLETVHELKKNKAADVNQSFVEFYEWLKAKFDTDSKAFDFYNEYLHFKNASNQVKEIVKFKSPVLGGKPKTKSKKKNFEKEKKLCNGFSGVNKERTLLTKRQLKVLKNVQLPLQKAIQPFELKNNNSENINLDCITVSNINCRDFRNQSIFEKPESLALINRNRTDIEYSSSLRSSEMQFKNIIKFRNLPESCFIHSSEICAKISKEKIYGCSISDSWESHYQDFIPKNMKFLKEGRKRNTHSPILNVQKKKICKKNYNVDFGFYNYLEASFCQERNMRKELPKRQNAEIQVDISEIPLQKVNAEVQTYYEASKSVSFENSYVFNRASYIATERKSECDFREDQNQCLQSILNQEVPNPDFWNSSTYLELEKNNPEVMCGLAMKSLKIDEIMEKNSSSNEFFCGHKSHTSSKLKNEINTSKETQTIAAIWTDSLTELGFGSNKASENIETQSGNLNSAELPKTIPIQEIEEVITQPIQPNFCLTERHDFVPKGLSPKVLYPETTKIFPLSPIEKCKLKLTIGDTQNDCLANVKWQDDSTGGCLKPIIPDEILFEMRRKTEKSGINYKNPILSASMSCCAVKVHNLLHSFALTKELLSGVEILGQLDKKFIVTKLQISAPKKMDLISLFDQHAVDERIKLEELINENLTNNGNLVSSYLNPPVECLLTDSDVRVVTDLQEKMLNFGLSIKSVNENTVIVNEIPLFLLNKHEKDLKNKKETLLSEVVKEVILSIVNEAKETRGAVPKIPKIVFDAFCLEACHKAIKFNKALTLKNMTSMIQKLQKCNLPFQCAHGRPSVIPIIDLEDVNSSMEENDTFDFQELLRFFNEQKDGIVTDDEQVAN